MRYCAGCDGHTLSTMGKRPQQKNVFDAVDKPRRAIPCTRLMRKENVLLDTQQPTSPTSDQRSPVDQARQTQSDATLQQKRRTHRPTQYTCNDFSSVLAAMSFVQSTIIPPSPAVPDILISTFARRIDNNQTTLQRSGLHGQATMTTINDVLGLAAIPAAPRGLTW